MSAFMVSDDTIRVIAIMATKDCGRWNLDAATKAAAVLHAQNVAALKRRYPGRWDDMFDPNAPVVTPGDAMRLQHLMRDTAIVGKQIRCFEYQACETSDWMTTQAKALCDAAMGEALSQLPGYEEAAWGLR